LSAPDYYPPKLHVAHLLLTKHSAQLSQEKVFAERGASTPLNPVQLLIEYANFQHIPSVLIMLSALFCPKITTSTLL
jgi:hypothetical protein